MPKSTVMVEAVTERGRVANRAHNPSHRANLIVTFAEWETSIVNGIIGEMELHNNRD
jgi:hypothetical protein